MKQNSLAQTNPYLRDPAKRAEAICRMVESSSAIEGINVSMSHKNGKFIATVQEPSEK